MAKRKQIKYEIDLSKLNKVYVLGREYNIEYVDGPITLSGEAKELTDQVDSIDHAVNIGKLQLDENGEIILPFVRGQTIEELRKIVVRKISNPDFMREVIWHELLHVLINSVMKLDEEEGLIIKSEEELVCHISEIIRTTISQNKEFFKELFEFNGSTKNRLSKKTKIEKNISRNLS